MTIQRCIMAAVLVLGLAAYAAGQAATQPAPAPATRPTAEVTDDVRPLLDAVGAAYRELESLAMEGTITGEFDVLGRQRKQVQPFTASYRAPMHFRHEADGDVQVGGTGEQLYVYLARNNLYRTDPVAGAKATLEKLPGSIPSILSFQNPMLALALSNDPTYELTDNVRRLTRRPDADIDGRAHPALQLELASGDTVEMRFDPQSHLIRQAIFDLRKSMEQRGAADVKVATMTVDYTALDRAPLSAEQFAWSPPMGARDAQEATSAGEELLASFRKIEGQPAPSFDLPALDGQRVALADLKGQVILLDFWATWCGPCVQSMPQLEQLHTDKAAAGLKVFAVNVAEEKAKVQAFIDQNAYTFPVLLDGDSAAAKAYGADRAIPYQVLIGADGVVKKVVVGAGGASKAAMEQAIHEQLTQP